MDLIPGPAQADGTSATAPPPRAILASSADVIVCTDAAGRFTYVSPGCASWFGWEPGELIGRRSDDLVDPEDLPLLRLQRREADRDGGTFVATFRFLGKDGSRRLVELAARQLVGLDGTWGVGALRDLTGRASASQLTDPLTGLPNRAMLMDRLRAALQRQARSTRRVAVLFIDLDHFKAVNDALGHSAGDAVLIQLATRLAAHLRPADTLARLGGDEFVVVAEDVGPEGEAIELAERLLVAGRESFLVEGRATRCTMSIGVAITREQGHGAADLLHDADLALYRAKAGGRDRVEHFDQAARDRRLTRRAMGDLLRTAVAEERLHVDYQPVGRLSDGRIDGVEALVRVLGPGGERLLPAAFLDVAEEHGLLAAIDDWVLVRVLDQALAWSAAGGPRHVTINLAARNLADPSFARRAIEELDRRGLPSDTLEAEVREDVLLRAAIPGLAGLHLLRGAGVRVGVDDFGSGSTSLAQLRELPVDFLKLDGSLARRIETAGRERATLAALITMSHALDLPVTAKEVETPEQLEVLASLGCDRAQGFAVGRPGPPESVRRRDLEPS